MNYMQEFEMWKKRHRAGEKNVWGNLVERGIRMFFNGKRHDFLLELMEHGGNRYNLRIIDSWITDHVLPNSALEEKIIIDVFDIAADRWLKVRRSEISAQIMAASVILAALTSNEDDRDIISRIDYPAGDGPIGTDLVNAIRDHAMNVNMLALRLKVF